MAVEPASAVVDDDSLPLGGAGLLSLALIVATLFARRHGTAWHGRIPVIFFDTLNTTPIESRIFQAAVAIIFVALPIYGIGHSMRVANEGVICEQVEAGDPPIHYNSGELRLILLPSAKSQLRLMPHDTPAGVCGGKGVELNWYTPIGFGALPLIAVICFGVWFYTVFIRKNPSSAAIEGGNEG